LVFLFGSTESRQWGFQDSVKWKLNQYKTTKQNFCTKWLQPGYKVIIRTMKTCCHWNVYMKSFVSKKDLEINKSLIPIETLWKVSLIPMCFSTINTIYACVGSDIYHSIRVFDIYSTFFLATFCFYLSIYIRSCRPSSNKTS